MYINNWTNIDIKLYNMLLVIIPHYQVSIYPSVFIKKYLTYIPMWLSIIIIYIYNIIV